MKYGSARFVYGLAAVVLFMVGVGTLIMPQGEKAPAGWQDLVRYIPGNLIIAVVPIGFGVFCWCRYRHWTKEAFKRK